jgi:hypothetical protein
MNNKKIGINTTIEVGYQYIPNLKTHSLLKLSKIIRDKT